MGSFTRKTIQAIRCGCERQETFPFHYEMRQGTEDHRSEVVMECPLCQKADVQFTVPGLFDEGEAHTPLPGPLRVLMMISRPEDSTIDNRLSYEEGEQKLLEALDPLWQTGEVEIDFTEDGSLTTLEQKPLLIRCHKIGRFVQQALKDMESGNALHS